MMEDLIVTLTREYGHDASGQGSPMVGPIIEVGPYRFGTLEDTWGYDYHPHGYEGGCGKDCYGEDTDMDVRTAPDIVAEWINSVIRENDWPVTLPDDAWFGD